nr:MAG TPA: hypothetical protein [Caudoviricetes sp.]
MCFRGFVWVWVRLPALPPLRTARYQQKVRVSGSENRPRGAYAGLRGKLPRDIAPCCS